LSETAEKLEAEQSHNNDLDVALSEANDTIDRMRPVVEAAQRIHESTVFFGNGKAEVNPKLMLDLKLACERMTTTAE
jgi:outer membrane protein OmpA-like peptidoglycan-associated protein